MLETFFAVLNPMLMLFICIALGFTLTKTKILPSNSGPTIAKLETWVFAPALSFVTMARYCTPKILGENIRLIIISSVFVITAVFIAIALSHLFVREKSPERGIYQYALTFANHGFLGDPLILAVFGEQMLFYYKLFTFPMYIVTYTWGLSVIIPSKEKSNPLKKLLNPPLIALVIGMIVGLLGIGDNLPVFMTSTLDSLKSCMGPLAMILCGITVARFDMKEMLTAKKVYIAAALRLFIIPSCFISALFGIRALLLSSFNYDIGTEVFYLMLVAYAGPLGLNTVVFPEAYGGNPKTGASMAMISHTLCVITIPIVFAILTSLLGAPTIA